MRVLILAALALALCVAHPTKYNVPRNESCVAPVPAKIYSYHVHVMFFHQSEENTAGALAIRDQFLKDWEGQYFWCDGEFHQAGLCVQPDIENYKVGPFTEGQWSIFVPVDEIGPIQQWFIQNRNGYDILIHPNSGCEIEDHDDWALWGGKPWKINLSAMGHDKPYDQTLNAFYEPLQNFE